MGFVTNSSGAFLYNGTPAQGNLVASITAVAGTDQFGNAYQAGVTSYQSGSSSATNFVQLINNMIELAFSGIANGVISPGPQGLVLSGQGLQFGNSTLLLFPSGDTTGVADQSRIQAALTNGQAVYLLPGTYYINGQVNVPTGGVLTGPPSGINTAPSASHVMPVIIKLANGANAHMINAAGDNIYVGNLELDGNKANQTSGFGNGVTYQSHFFALFENLFIHDQRFRGINAVSGAAAQIVNCSMNNNGDVGIFLDSRSNDLHIKGCQVSSNANDGLHCEGFVCHIEGNDIFSNAGNGIKIANGRGCLIASNGIDHNQQHGIVITAAAGSLHWQPCDHEQHIPLQRVAGKQYVR
jgi:hypothetical protein